MKHPIETGSTACLSLIAAITANQEQLEFWLRIVATLVAIAAGVVSIFMTFRPAKAPANPADKKP